ncbi:MAG: hypothetical protein QHC77_12150 [Stenotrophomonas sp.]|uniref:hypothetical protein n=1 Tax=Stenotrophomonas sp. TaxID=69392 RepID=UPI0029B03815|nr:hypothetical protein [Stenotrophomonas sp.]MDX3932676.1 hypothetical protein [Stenotrophomonas sp.]
MEFLGILWQNAEKVSGIAAVVAFVIAALSLAAQRGHNKLSVTPLPEVTFKDLEGEVCITLKNHGTGPLIIEWLDISKNGRLVGKTLIEQMPEHIRTWDWFVGVMDGRSIPVGGEIVLLKLTTGSGRRLKEVRSVLRHLTIHIIYTDVYRGSHPVYRKCLDWFGRHD